MISINSVSYSLNINLNNGLYEFLSQSGTGKSYLSSVIIPQYRNAGYRFYSVTYEAGLTDAQYIEQIKARLPLDLLVVDRYDLYESKTLNEFLISIADSCIILIDSKYGLRDVKCRAADMVFKKDGFDIYDNAIRR